MPLFLYNTALWFYALGIRLAAAFYPKAKLFSEGRRDIYSRLQTALLSAGKQRPVIWMHCASLGEFEQGRPVLEAIRAQFPEYALLLTFFSPSGYEVRKKYEGVDWVFYLPMDSKRNAVRFLNIVQPSLALFVKYEFWYHYLHELKKRKIRAILFSAHFQNNQPFFKPWGRLFRKMLSFYQQIFVQDVSSDKLLKGIGIEAVTVAGDTRLDRAAKVLMSVKEFPKLEAFKQDARLLIAGSTWPEDEYFLKKALAIIPKNGYKLLIAPHDVQGQNIQRVLNLFGDEACLWDAPEHVLMNKKVAVVHTIGQLSYLYRYADVTWVGGGFGKGIHNIIEPAVFGKPVSFGPHFERFKEAKEMVASGAASSFTEASAFASLLLEEKILHQMGNRAGAYVAQHAGATEKIMDYLTEKCFDITS